MCAPLVCAWSVLCEAHPRQDGDDALLHGLRLLFRLESECAFNHLRETDVGAVIDPRADRFIPSVGDKARILFDGCERFEFRRLKPPLRARLV